MKYVHTNIISEDWQKLADFYQETLGFTPNSLFTMMHRPRIAIDFQEMNYEWNEITKLNHLRNLFVHSSNSLLKIVNKKVSAPSAHPSA